MGKCLSCLKDNSSANKHRDSDQSSELNKRFHFSSVTYSAESRLSSEHTSLSRHNNCSVSLIADSSNPAASFENSDLCTNGISKLPGIMGVTGGSASSGGSSDKRSFYARIPPLTRSSSHETRRHSSRDSYSEAKINTLFDIYRHSPKASEDDSEDVILSHGIQKFCADLELRPDDFKVLLFAWKCEAETMCRFTRSEFTHGCKSLKVDSIKGIISKFSEMEAEVQNIESFKKMYKWAFKFGLDSDMGQRILPSEMASLLWKLVFEQRKPNILDRWLGFLESHQSIRGIPRDTWNMFLTFSETIGDDLSIYDDTEAWPSLFDDFVEYENDQLNQNITKEQKA